MAKMIDRLLSAMRGNPAGVRFADAVSVAEHFFGPPRRSGTSHVVFKAPWPGNPRVNLQPGDSGKAKAYQVRQLIEAIERLETLNAPRAEREGESDD